MRRLLLGSILFVLVGYAIWLHPPIKHPIPSDIRDASENWAIQGVYSQLDCHNQPGTHPDYEAAPSVDADGNESFLIYFLGCK